jgi:hypothetical protein
MWAVGVGVFGALVAIWGVAAASMGMEQANLNINVGSVVQCVVFGAYGTKWQPDSSCSQRIRVQGHGDGSQCQWCNRAIHEEYLTRSKRQTTEIRIAGGMTPIRFGEAGS